MNNKTDIALSNLEVVLISLISGMVIGLLTLCFYRPLVSIAGGNLSHETGGIINRGISSGLISLLGIFPMLAMFRSRCDFIARVIVGPTFGLGAFIALLFGGIYRWGTPPSFAWPLGGLYLMYIIFLSIAVMIVVKKFTSESVN